MDFHGKVIQFFYVGEDPVEPYNLRHIPGKHEALLNSACYAYSHGLVQDWIAFFRSNWCHALFHDQFIDLLASLRRVLQTDKGTILVMNRVFENAEENLDNLEVSNFRREFIGTHGEKLSKTTDELIEEGVNDFLRKNKHMLSSYHVTNK